MTTTTTTNYFGALLRSAGHPVAGAASVAAVQPSVQAGADLMEIDAEREAQATDAGTAVVRLQPASAPVRQAEGGAVPSTHAPWQPKVRAPSPLPATRDAAAPTPDVVDLSPPSLHTTVQAALAWVASDPQAHAGAGTASAVDGEGTVVRQPVLAPGIEEVSQDVEAFASTEGAIDGAGDDDDDRGTVPQGPSNNRRTAPVPSAERRTRAAPAAREEPIEVTIGAIHLHVDAPPPAAIAPAPSPPAAAPSLRTPAPRSALSRRALYRL
ncbi:hypothetical protein SAMN05216567_102104 [Variovorax sp. OK605]|uniref:hypothetical protein n=1 Tax=Variovorax sp. OK605 TaxID=1855317 RepID=UPI0008E0269E|nr:hypothetical protein [Variovorax sp. OK605]SFO68894.1 hypothetical protein SAMN05216567_102104 [Variovorax sp. OK605]